MASEPVLSGEIPQGGVLDILREIEGRRITGKIRFVVGAETGEVELVAGQIAMDQDPLPNGADPVEALLGARSGIYAVHAVLPQLPVSQGNDHERRGSLAVHVPADLMTYCEHAGLTGVLEMRNEGRVVEVLYEAGEMLGIRLDGREEANLDQVFAWDQGAFRVLARTEDDVRSRLPPPMTTSEPPPPPEPDDPSEREPTVRYARALPQVPDGGATSRYAKVDASGKGREDTGRNFLRVIEMALTDVVSVREKARASVRSAPPPKARPSARPPARPTRQKDTTVRIVWVGGEPSVEHAVPEAARAPLPEAPKVAPKPAEAAKPSPPRAEDAPRASPGPAKASEVAAKAAEGAAKAAEGAAKASEGAAKASEGAAKASEGAAKASEGAAKASEGAAKASEGPTSERPPVAAPPKRSDRPGPADHGAALAGEPDEGSTTTIALLVAFLVALALVAFLLTR
jgi:hypothetical protein